MLDLQNEKIQEIVLLYKQCYHEKVQEFCDSALYTIGSSSRRRIVQMQKLYPNAKFESIRGNVQTRLRKLEEQEFDATALAVAGLKRLGLTQRIDRIFSVEEVIPAAGQGIIAIQGRKGMDYSFLDGVCDWDSELAAGGRTGIYKRSEWRMQRTHCCLCISRRKSISDSGHVL